MLNSAWPDTWTNYTYNGRGLMTKQFIGHQSIVERFYDGDGREVKRKKQSYSEDPEPPYTVTWDQMDDIFYIRSTVLGGQVISETGPTGKKKKTNVYAAGTQIATQSEHVNLQNATVQNLYFSHSDASGMSNRSSMTNGQGFWGVGFEGAPAETDPMGGNMGLESPYIEILEYPQHPEPVLMPAIPLEDQSPMMVNGQAVQCTLDGMTIGCATAMGMMQSGSAIPAALARYQHLPGFQFNSQGLGIYNVTVPYEVPGVWTVTTTSTGGTTSDQQWVWNPGYMSSTSFSLSVNWGSYQSLQSSPKWTVEELVKGARDVIKNAIENDPKGKCAKLLGKDALKKFNEIAGNIEYNANIEVGDRSDSGRKLLLGEQPRINAVTFGKDVFLNPNGDAFQNLDRIPPNDAGKRLVANLEKMFKDSGASSQKVYALATIIHEFLHTTGKFKDDVKVKLDGTIDSSQSIKNQERVIKDCFSQ